MYGTYRSDIEIEKAKPWAVRAEKGFVKLTGIAAALRMVGLSDVARDVEVGAVLLREAIERGLKGKDRS